MERWKLTVAYDGTRFSGWQKQPDRRTVQGELEQALSTFYGEPVGVTGQGRTDSGVHAESQVLHADLPGSRDPERLEPAMRGLLPEDVALVRAEPAAPAFHARFDAVSRRYRYQISCRPAPLDRHLWWVCREEPDPGPLHRCAEFITGTHDFRHFSKLEKGDFNARCTVTFSEWSQDGVRLTYRIEGNRFLRHQVRRLVGSMYRVATGKLAEPEFRRLLDGEEQVSMKGHSAPAAGLILENVRY